MKTHILIRCRTCPYAKEKRCPLACQQSVFCPKEPEKPLLKNLKKDTAVCDLVFTLFEN